MLIVGSTNSSNAARLVEVARREGCRAELIEDASEIRLGWLDEVARIGLTAGASAPEALVTERRRRARCARAGHGDRTPNDRRDRAISPYQGRCADAHSVATEHPCRFVLPPQEVERRKRYPFIVEIEPLFACNLSCPGCGKIQHPTDILRKRLSVKDVVECGRRVRHADGLHRRRGAAAPS